MIGDCPIPDPPVHINHKNEEGIRHIRRVDKARDQRS